MTSTQQADLIIDELPAAERSLRIAVVTETYPPEVNGVAITIARFVEGLRARRHDVQLIRPRQHKTDIADAALDFHEVLLRGLPIPRYPHLKMGVPSKNALVKLWTQRRPDVVHIVTEGPLGWSALRAARQLKLAITSDFRTNFHAYSKHYGIGWLQKPIFAYLRKFHNRTQCTMVPTESLRGELAAMGFHQLKVVARGVDTVRFSPAKRSETLRAAWGADHNTTVVLYVGRLASEKNLGLLVDAYKAMRNVNPRAKLVMVGDGPARGEIEAQFPDAIFAGQRTGDDLAVHYASGDLFLFPSITETFGNVTPEAMASGLTVLAYNYAAAAQLITHKENGLLAPFNSSNDFIAMARAIAAEHEPIRTMGAAARSTAEQLDWPGVVAQLETVLLDAVKAVANTQAVRDMRADRVASFTGAASTQIGGR